MKYCFLVIPKSPGNAYFMKFKKILNKLELYYPFVLQVCSTPGPICQLICTFPRICPLWSMVITTHTRNTSIKFSGKSRHLLVFRDFPGLNPVCGTTLLDTSEHQLSFILNIFTGIRNALT
jgi:hypothetical protein